MFKPPHQLREFRDVAGAEDSSPAIDRRSRASEPSYTLACSARMNQHAEACRSKALEYERAAKLAAAAPVRRMYLDLARQLHDWAEQAERQAGKDLPLSAA